MVHMVAWKTGNSHKAMKKSQGYFMSYKKTKAQYVVGSLSKISRKGWELFIVSRIIHSIHDDIEFVCQQMVKRPDGSIALTDLFFPQFNLHLEIDEPFHTKQVQSDHKRAEDIVLVTGHTVDRISVLNKAGEFKPIEKIRDETDSFVNRLHSHRKDRLARGTYEPWDWEKRYSAEAVIARGYMDIKDNVVFRTQVEALRCFGFRGKGWQRGAWQIPDGSEDWVWFPRLYQHHWWTNELSPDGAHIFERAMNQEGVLSIKQQLANAQKNPSRKIIVLAKAKDSLGLNLLRYVGTFNINLSASVSDCIQFDLVRTREPIRINY